MKVDIFDDKKEVHIWLTRDEGECEVAKKQLDALYKKYAAEKYLVVLFRSGRGDLAQLTSDLLCYNKVRVTQLANADTSRHNAPLL